MQPVLAIEDLTVAYRAQGRWLAAVRDFSLRIEPGQTVGLVGESGSGKTTVALAVMRYLSHNGRIQRGDILFDGRNLLDLSPTALRDIWGAQLALVPQDPLSSLNPSLRVGAQMAELLRRHVRLNRAQAAARVVALLEMVRVPDPPRVAQSYPHQISGGMQQRVLIAMALSTEPKLLVLDEPTTGLDVTSQAAVLDLLRDLVTARQTSTLYVTHNLGVVARICDRVAVLYAGELVEEGPTRDLYRQPLHPYTQGLLHSVPQLGQRKTGVTLQAIPGQIPALAARPAGCVFAPRCALALERCHAERPSLETPAPGRRVRCHRWPEIAAGEISVDQAQQAAAAPQAPLSATTLLSMQDLEVHFDVGRSWLEALAGKPPRRVRAVDGVSLTLAKGQTLGVVGESGSGKTTLARAVIGLAARTGGEIELLGAALPARLGRRPLETLRRLQFVFQNPEESLNPYLTVGETLRRPFRTLLNMSRTAADAEVARLLAAVRLPASYRRRLPGQLSGGEKQRVAIARAFATNPDLLLADEPVSALDVSVQASILNLLHDLQNERHSTLIFISHDLAVVGYLADQIAVMYLGRLMEVAAAADLFTPPYHPYTEALLSAIPLLDPDAAQEAIRLEGDAPGQMAVTRGCPFHPRCPRVLGDLCRTETPPWQTAENGKRIFCHIPLDELAALQGEGSRD
jgi:peptide/nickel transport system ATP-binding protein